MRDLMHRIASALMPWYRPDDARKADERTERIHTRSIAARIRAEQAIESYEAAGRAMRR